MPSKDREDQQLLRKVAAPFISQIFEQQTTAMDPTFIYTRNNILIILLCFCAYGLYLLFGQYLNPILVAFLSGVAYIKGQQRFINMWVRNKNSKNKQTETSILGAVFYAIGFFIIPWIRNQSKNSYGSIDYSFNTFWSSFLLSTNPVVRITQLYCFIKVLYALFGNKLEKWFTFQRLGQKGKIFLKFSFFLLTFLGIIIFFITFSIVVVTESGRLYQNSKDFTQKVLECKFYIHDDMNDSYVPCTQKLAKNFQNYIPTNFTINFNQSEYNECIKLINNAELSYLGSDYFDYEDDICIAFQYINNISPNFLQSLNLKSTTSWLLQVVKNIVFSFFNSIIDFFFIISIFFSIMITTTKFYDSISKIEIFESGQKANLTENIANIISASIFIAIQNLFFGIFIFQLLRFTDFNTILSLLLSILSFFPLIPPYFILLIVVLIKMKMTQYYASSLICFFIYYLMNSRIHSKYYAKVDSNIVIINLSVVFGIYQYGVLGIFYGPLIILIFQCISQTLQITKGKHHHH